MDYVKDIHAAAVGMEEPRVRVPIHPSTPLGFRFIEKLIEFLVLLFAWSGFGRYVVIWTGPNLEHTVFFNRHFV